MHIVVNGHFESVEGAAYSFRQIYVQLMERYTGNPVLACSSQIPFKAFAACALELITNAHVLPG